MALDQTKYFELDAYPEEINNNTRVAVGKVGGEYTEQMKFDDFANGILKQNSNAKFENFHVNQIHAPTSIPGLATNQMVGVVQEKGLYPHFPTQYFARINMIPGTSSIMADSLADNIFNLVPADKTSYVVNFDPVEYPSFSPLTKELIQGNDCWVFRVLANQQYHSVYLLHAYFVWIWDYALPGNAPIMGTIGVNIGGASSYTPLNQYFGWLTAGFHGRLSASFLIRIPASEPTEVKIIPGLMNSYMPWYWTGWRPPFYIINTEYSLCRIG